jgi:hypothetical protein
MALSVLLAACQAVPVAPTPTPPPTTAPTPAASPAPTPTAAPPPGVLWVDLGQDLGEINPMVLGANHGPWSDLGASNLEPAEHSGVTFLRWPGGNWGDNNDIQTYYIDTYMFQARLMGAVPSIVVRLPNSTPEKAAALVRYANVEKQYAIPYWGVGNEPSLYESSTVFEPLGLNAVKFAQEWRVFAEAMKAVDPTIKLYGPDIHQFKGDPAFDPRDSQGRYYLQEFLKINGDLVDVVTVHRYPFPTCVTCNTPSPEELLANTPEWDNIIPNLRRIVREVTGKDLPVGVTEFNSSYSNIAGAQTSPDSFVGALWLADVMGRMIRHRPEMLAYWLLKNNSAGPGLMSTYDLRPSYYVFQIYKQFGNHLLAASSDEPMLSVFAARRDDGSVTVIFVNRGEAQLERPLQLAQGDALRLAEAYLFDAGHNAEPLTPPGFKNGDSIVLAARSVTLFVFKP